MGHQPGQARPTGARPQVCPLSLSLSLLIEHESCVRGLQPQLVHRTTLAGWEVFHPGQTWASYFRTSPSMLSNQEGTKGMTFSTCFPL